MTTTLIILLSILSGIYLERGRIYIKRRIKASRYRARVNSQKKIDYYLKPLSDLYKAVGEQDEKRRQHAMEDRLSNKLPFPACTNGPECGCKDKCKCGYDSIPFAGGRPFAIVQFKDGERCIYSGQSLEDQLQDALEREDYAKAIELRDKMKER
jgi:hypothetical protein